MPARAEPGGTSAGHTRLISALPDFDESLKSLPSQRAPSNASLSRRRSQQALAADLDDFSHSSTRPADQDDRASDSQRRDHLDRTQLLNIEPSSVPSGDDDLFDDIDVTRVQTHDDWSTEQTQSKHRDGAGLNETDEVWSTAETTTPLGTTSPGRNLRSKDHRMSEMQTKAVALNARPKTGGRLAKPPPFEHLYAGDKGEGQDDGPDPTPRKRIPKRRNQGADKPQSSPSPRRSLDAARPKPIGRPKDERREKQPQSAPAKKGIQRTNIEPPKDTLFDKVNHRFDQDLIANVVQSAQENDRGHNIVERHRSIPPRRQTWFNYAIFGFMAIVVGVGIALIITSGKVEKEQVQGRQQASKLSTSVVRLGIRPLPMVRADSIRDEPFLAMNQRAVDSSFGPIDGLTSTLALDKNIVEQNGQIVYRPLYEKLKSSGTKGTLLVALKPNDVVKNLALIGQSAIAAGYAEFALVVERSNDGRLGAFPLTAGDRKVPAIGYLSVRIGQLGVYAEILGRNGEKLSGDLSVIAPLADGRINYDALDRRLDRLNQAAPLVRLAVLSLAGETSVADTMVLVGKLRFGPQRERFTTVRIVPQ